MTAFHLLNTDTEGEADLRRENARLATRVFALENALIGVVELLHEHGIDAPEFDPDVAFEGTAS